MKNTLKHRLKSELKFTKTSFVLLFLVMAMLGAVLWHWWYLFIDYHSKGTDWLLIWIFVFMLFLLMVNANLKRDITLILVALGGGFLIEAWGTHTLLWQYYTELPPWNDPSRPPLWIIPAWPTSALAINRMTMIVNALWAKSYDLPFKILYWLSGLAGLYLLIDFSMPSVDTRFTQVMIFITIVFVFTPLNPRRDALIVFCGSLLGYVLEYWGTSRGCWVYYSGEVPPLFPVLGHGYSSMLFARLALMIHALLNRVLGSDLPTHRS